jgi:NhaA family Na+:H+ antiporter
MALRRQLDEFFSGDAAGGVFLILSAAAAMMIANSSLSGLYNAVLDTNLSILLNEEGLSKPLILWINDGLMAVFFLLVGLELKRELLEGKLKNPRDVILPGLAAVGGMAVPAAIYAALNWGNPATITGWAIPAATDIAFALGILALVGSRVPSSLKIFLLTLAILDDMGAIIIIALFYTADLKVDYLMLAAIPLALMVFLNHRGVHRIAPILLLGAVMWVFVLKSGVHATLAGVVTAFFIPLKDRYGKSPLHGLEDGLSPYVFYMIVPVFAFANAGVVLHGLGTEELFASLTIGIAAGLFFGKIGGVLGVTWLMVRMGWARLPTGASWTHMLGVSALAGIGFTMSLFIGTLSFPDATQMNEVRLGVLGGSAIAAVFGYLVLRLAPSVEPGVRKAASTDTPITPGSPTTAGQTGA